MTVINPFDEQTLFSSINPVYRTSSSDATKKEAPANIVEHAAQRGFERTSRYLKDCEALGTAPVALPTRKTFHSAGYDFACPADITLYPGESIIVFTGIKAWMQPNEFLAMFIRSSYGIKKHLRIKNVVGIIDSDYYNNPDNEGEILVCLINEGSDPAKIPAGESFAQGIFMTYLTDGTVPLSARTGGVGSTDK